MGSGKGEKYPPWKTSSQSRSSYIHLLGLDARRTCRTRKQVGQQ
jgi:hypothetical protein